MGGKVFVMGGDFRQVLPVVRRANPGQVVAVTLCRSSLWSDTGRLRLIENMRTGANQQEYARWLLSVGDGTEPTYPGTDCIKLPDSMVAPSRTVADLLSIVYGDLTVPHPPSHFVERAILTPRNDEVDRINDMVTNLTPGQVSLTLSCLI